MAIWNISQTLGIFFDHLITFLFIWYIFSGFGIMHPEKSGNPAEGAPHGSTSRFSRLNLNWTFFVEKKFVD
jgi:hypothetical protein